MGLTLIVQEALFLLYFEYMTDICNMFIVFRF